MYIEYHEASNHIVFLWQMCNSAVSLSGRNVKCVHRQLSEK